jgi:hypothetical protein
MSLIPIESCLEGMNRQSNLKLTLFKSVKITGSDMFGLRSDMSGLGRICLAWGRIYPVKQEHTLQKSRSGAKTMNLGLDELTTCKLNTIELREIK